MQVSLSPEASAAFIPDPVKGDRTMNGHRKLSDRRAPTRPSFTAPPTSDQSMVAEIDKMVMTGHQKELTAYFESHEQVPARAGDWQLNTNIRRLNGSPVGRTIVATPLSVRSRKIFEAGCIATLRNAGYTEEESARYYKVAWRKKYVWVDAVISAVKEMIDAFQVDGVLESYELAGDPRRLAQTIMVPKNPYLTSHAHFLVAVEMARLIIRLRNNGDEDEVKVAKAPASKPTPDFKEMVAA